MKTGGVMLVVGPHKLLVHVDGTTTLVADMPGGPPQEIQVPPGKTEEFFKFLGLVCSSVQFWHP